MKNFLHFLQYHNAVPIALGVVILGGGATFAATDPQAVYSQSQQTVSIDNTYLVDKDLSSYTPTVQITAVTEDTDNYYVAYNFSTIDLADGTWKDVVKPETLTVSKADLGPYRDLGVYVTQQLKQNIDNELARLTQTQEIEKKNVSLKTVATTYGGLIGKMLNDTTETLPGYVPVVSGPPEPVQQTASAGAATGDTSSTSQTTSSSSSGNPSLKLQVLGNNPAQIAVGTRYADLGAIATDAHNDVLRIDTYLDGQPAVTIVIDTSTTSTHTIRYVASDLQHNSLSMERTVIVYDPASGPPVPDSQVVQNGSVGGNVPVIQAVTVDESASSTPQSGGSSSGSSSATSTDTTQTATTTPDTATTTPSSDTSTDTATTTPDDTSGASTTPPDTSTPTPPDQSDTSNTDTGTSTPQ